MSLRSRCSSEVLNTQVAASFLTPGKAPSGYKAEPLFQDSCIRTPKAGYLQCTGVSDLWLASSGGMNPDYILAQSIPIPFYDSVLTLLRIEQVGYSLQDDEEGALDELNPQDFTLGRRKWPR